MDDSEYYTDYLDEEEDLDMLDEQNDSSYQLGSDASDDEVNQIDENVLKSAIAMASMATGSTELANNLTVNWNEQPADTEAGGASDDSEDSEPQPNQPRMTSRLRSTSKQPTTYDVKKLGPELEDSVEHEAFLTDDDEDSNYEDEEEDDLFGDMDELKDTLRGISGIGRSKKKTKRGRGRPVNQHKLKPEAQRLMGMANTLFVDRKLDDAYEILCEVIRMDANAQEAWYTMALIRDEQGRPDDSVHLYTLAAHLQPSNYELWERLSTMHCEAAERKEHAGKSGDEDWQAALYCISNAIKNGPRHVPILKRKLALQERVGDSRITRTYHELLRAEPHNLELVRSAARYVVIKRDDVATPLGWFTTAMAHYNELARRFAAMYADGSADDSAGGELAAYYQSNEHLTVSMEGVEGYDYSDVNMVAELHIMRHAYEDAISAIKRGARFIQGRGNELQWERVEIEDSWDAEYNAPSADAPDGAGHELPVELRAKLGQCRLLLGQTDQAHVHLAVVDQQDISVYGDVFLDIGRSMVDVGHAQEAVGLLERLRQQPAADSPELWEPLARAYRELGSWELARMYFEQVVEARPTDIESRMFLAEVLEELKHVDRAFELIREVELIQADTARADEARKQSADARADHGIVRRVQRGRRKKSAPNNADSSTDRHIAMMRKADRWFARLDELAPLIGSDANARAEYRQTAHLLYTDWKRMPVFYMADRSRPFRGYRTIAINNLENGIDLRPADQPTATQVQRRMARIKRRLAKKSDETDDDFSLVPTTFLKHSFGEWHGMFLAYAKCLALDGDSPRALKLLDDVVQCNCFARDHERRRAFKMATLTVALRYGDAETVYEAMRYMWGSRPTKAAVYRLASYAMCYSPDVATMMSSGTMYKFTRRQLIFLESIAYHGSGMLPLSLARLEPFADSPSDVDQELVVDTTKEGLDVTWRDVAALHSMAANVMAASRTSTQAVMQYTLAQAILPEDAGSALNLGIAYFVYGSKADTLNRHRVLLQGFTYIQRYAELRCKQAARAAGIAKMPEDLVVIQEIAYNYARAFHFAGAEHLAVSFYGKVFDLPVSLDTSDTNDGDEDFSDLRREAAYNLASIYITSGSMHLAKELLVKYCTI